MLLPNSLLDLALGAENDEEPKAHSRRLKEAAELVQVFSQETGHSALGAALEAVDRQSPAGRETVRTVAAEVLQQNDMLDQEVRRFLEIRPTAKT